MTIIGQVPHLLGIEGTSGNFCLLAILLLRRLMLLAWMGTHSHSKESRTKAITYAEGSCMLAERYLSSNGHRLA